MVKIVLKPVKLLAQLDMRIIKRKSVYLAVRPACIIMEIISSVKNNVQLPRSKTIRHRLVYQSVPLALIKTLLHSIVSLLAPTHIMPTTEQASWPVYSLARYLHQLYMQMINLRNV